MPLVVQKFGGSSVATPERMRRCADRVLQARRRGDDVVAVVSAMGDTTDDLLALAERVTGTPQCDRRELDQLLATGEQVSIALMAMLLQQMGQPAVSLTGAQAGIVTEPVHGRARITRVDRGRLDRELGSARVPVVAGFQGLTEDGELTTLGRGGSDTTAVALAGAIGASVCEIYTDVDGIFTADPRLVPSARRRDLFTYDEMLEAASLGAKVMHPRAVEVGKRYRVPIRVLHSQLDGAGTVIAAEDPEMESRLVAAVALKTELGRVSLRDLPARAGVQSEVFAPIAAAGISVDDIIQEESGPDRLHLVFTLEQRDVAEAHTVLARIVENGAFPGARLRVDTGFCKVSAVGAGMRSHAGVAAAVFQSLADHSIRIESITTSEIAISCLLQAADGPRALRAVHDAFGLHSPVAEREVLRAIVTDAGTGSRAAAQT